MDSGATDHICPSLDKFLDYTPVNSSDNSITIPDGTKVPILHKGTVVLNDKIILKNVLHVPDFQFYLIFVTQLCKDLNCLMLFSDSKCFIQDPSQKSQLMLLGNLTDGLYSAISNSNSPVPVNATSSSSYFGLVSQSQTEAQIWHLRLGHFPFHQMRLLKPHLNIF